MVGSGRSSKRAAAPIEEMPRYTQNVMASRERYQGGLDTTKATEGHLMRKLVPKSSVRFRTTECLVVSRSITGHGNFNFNPSLYWTFSVLMTRFSFSSSTLMIAWPVHGCSKLN